MNVMELFGKTLELFNLDNPEILIPDTASKTQVENSIKFNNSSNNNYLKILAGRAGLALILAGLCLAWEHNKREQEKHDNEERRKEEMHQAQMKKMNEEINKEV